MCIQVNNSVVTTYVLYTKRRLRSMRDSLMKQRAITSATKSHFLTSFQQQALLKHQQTSSRLYGATTQKTVLPPTEPEISSFPVFYIHFLDKILHTQICYTGSISDVKLQFGVPTAILSYILSSYGKRRLGRCKMDNIEMNLGETGCDNVDYIHLTQDID
jgi:hypothetical protein